MPSGAGFCAQITTTKYELAAADGMAWNPGDGASFKNIEVAFGVLCLG